VRRFPGDSWRLGRQPDGTVQDRDNFLEASAENILFGGGEASLTPADIEISQNHFFKPLIWMKGQPGYVGGTNGNPFIVKNLLELKNAQRLLLDGNIMEYSWVPDRWLWHPDNAY